MPLAYCFVEYFFTRGEYDSQELVFTTFWSGTVRERWEKLASVQLDPLMGWYVLSFRHGRKVRISRLLLGHSGVLALLSGRGFSFP